MSPRFTNSRGVEITLDWFLCEDCGLMWSWPRSGHFLAGAAPEKHMRCSAKVWQKGSLVKALRFLKERLKQKIKSFTTSELNEHLDFNNSRGNNLRRTLKQYGIISLDSKERIWHINEDKLKEYIEAYESSTGTTV